MLEEIELHATRSESFGFETTLSGRSYLRLIRHLKKRGYEVHFFFLWISTVRLALTRVKARVFEGGHTCRKLWFAAALTARSGISCCSIALSEIPGRYSITQVRHPL